MSRPGRFSPGVFGSALAAVVAGGILLPAVFMSGAHARDLRIVTPRDGAVLPPGKTLVIGVAGGGKETRADLDVNGKSRQQVEIRNGAFRATVSLPAGRNVIRAAVGGTETKAAVHASAKAAYAYHEPVEKCGECHAPAGRGHAVSRPTDALCYRCHDRLDKRKQVHGPIASGDCTSCHDPHASGHPKLTVAEPGALCVTCHDQKSSEAHFRESKGKACTACHDPHSSEKAFLQL